MFVSSAAESQTIPVFSDLHEEKKVIVLSNNFFCF